VDLRSDGHSAEAGTTAQDTNAEVLNLLRASVATRQLAAGQFMEITVHVVTMQPLDGALRTTSASAKVVDASKLHVVPSLAEALAPVLFQARPRQQPGWCQRHALAQPPLGWRNRSASVAWPCPQRPAGRHPPSAAAACPPARWQLRMRSA
jgi:hypothetical protein